jgi:protein Mpv17
MIRLHPQIRPTHVVPRRTLRTRNVQRRTYTKPNPQPQPPKVSNLATAETASKSIPGPSYFWLDSLSTPLQAFARAQAKRPYLTQFISTLIIYLLGDLSAQKLAPADPDEPYSPARTMRALIIGGVAAIPGYRWFLWLGTSFNYSSKVLSIAVKVAVNQVFFTPLFNSYFFGMQRALSGGSPAEIAERIVNTVPTSWINSLKLWPAVTAFSFTFVPLHFRSIFAGVIAIGWQTYLSFLNQKAARKERESREHEPTLKIE